MGSTDSLFLAINTVHYHLEEVVKSHPNLKHAAEFIKKYLYVDDLLGATDTINEAIELRTQIQKIFAMMKMQISKWSSNSIPLLRTIPKEELSPYEEVNKEDIDITFGDPDIISQGTKCLGMSWIPKKDVFNYSSYKGLSEIEEKSLKLTKRGISSLIPKIYDPTGLLQPFILKGKLILQQTWVYKSSKGEPLGWDDKLPEEIKNQWLKWVMEIKEAAKFEVNRYLFKTLNNVPSRKKLSLHGFSDAGEKAWGVAIYIRYFNEETKLHESHLIYSATRVAPTKVKLSIPRKELNGIVLLCEKLLYIAKSLDMNNDQVFAHTDSLVSMHWINKNKNNLKTYISNRVEKIQQSNLQILFTPGKQNPADLCSKPHPSKEYINNTFWTTGPSYIQQGDDKFIEEYRMENVLKSKLPEEELENFNIELKPITSININAMNIQVKEPEGIYQVLYKYNKYSTILNVVAQCFRAIFLMTKNMKNEERKMQLRKGFQLKRISTGMSNTMSLEEQKELHTTPSIKEITFSKNYLIKEAQRCTYPEEYLALEQNQEISEKSSLIKLNPKLREGLIIMKGRLDNLQTMPEQLRNPIILPKDTRITSLIIYQHHLIVAHSGPELTLRNVRLQYWLPGGRSQIRKAIKRLCGHNICKHPYPQGHIQQIANLPIPRITPGNFKAISLDFAGPFYVKKCGDCKNEITCQKCLKKINSQPQEQLKSECATQKCYICVFACHSSRAVHLELMMNRTTESFILAIKRMANRRGMPHTIHSDNGSEMIKAKNDIKKLYETLNTAATHKELQNKYNIKWYHSTERSPQHNGVIERIVQTVKKPFYKVLNARLFTEGELNTILTDCEAASNMRPISATSENPEDDNLIPLTPCHLTVGEAIIPLPSEIYEYEEKHTKKTVKEKWKQRKLVANHYWKLWKEEYLTTLRILTKNYIEKQKLKEGDLVLDLLAQTNKLDWPIRVVHEALIARVPGKEAKVRSVWLRHPIPANKVTDKGKHLTQHKYSRRGIEHVSLLEEALELGPQENNNEEE